MKSVVVYWSMTGNTEEMAKAIKDGAGDNCDIFEVGNTDAQTIASYQAIALGCPAMGDEILEENEFQPFFDELLPKLKDQQVFLFGSYDWGDGQWMQNWEEICTSNKVKLAYDSIISNLEPDENTINELKKIGENFSK